MASKVMESEIRAYFFSMIQLARGISEIMFRGHLDMLYRFA
jgi:hypothetical protein